MKIAFASLFDPRDIHQWSGAPYFMTQSLQQENVEIDYVCSLKTKLPRQFKFQQLVKRLTGQQRDSARFNSDVIKSYAKQIQQQLSPLNPDAILATQVDPIALLDTAIPMVLWTDALFASLLGFYAPSSTISDHTIRQANLITEACLERCRLAIFTSDWAARGAIELYGMNKDKVKVVPFGANITSHPTLTEMRDIIARRDRHTIKFLFLAREWERKGGDTVLAVAKALHKAGQAVEVTIAGCVPPIVNLPNYISCYPFISKTTAEGKQQLDQLLCESHFLFVPSRAEAFGIVFCEACAFGLPILTTYVGGISTIVKDNINGMTFSVNASIDSYCHYISSLFQQPEQYAALALSAYHEYESRLNWQTASQQVKRLILEKI